MAPLCWDGLLMDISHLKQVELDLKHERDLFDGVVDHQCCPRLVVFDTEGKFVFVNPRGGGNFRATCLTPAGAHLPGVSIFLPSMTERYPPAFRAHRLRDNDAHGAVVSASAHQL